jgi:sugar/nucleoside kinase (ribokinase family)
MSARLAPRQHDGFIMDVVGIGALNLDYIVEVPHAKSRARFEPLADRILRVVGQLGGQLELETEAFVDDRTIKAVLESARALPLRPTLGGSAFTAIHAMARTQVGLRLGYVGVAGNVPVPGLSAITEMSSLGIDHSHVLRDESRLCGICFSFTQEGERTLLISPGANMFIDDYLESEYEEIVTYLAGARLIHVTSFPGSRIASHLLRILRAAKETAPAAKVSFDPGHAWCKEHSSVIDEIVGLADYLLVNHREFRELGRYVDGDTDEDVAHRLVRQLGGGTGVVILKRPDGTHSFRSDHDRLESEFHPQAVLTPRQIRDATGAGDIFAAGLLAMLACERLQIELGCMLGMRLARHKLRHTGSRGTNLSNVTRNFVKSREHRI